MWIRIRAGVKSLWPNPFSKIFVAHPISQFVRCDFFSCLTSFNCFLEKDHIFHKFSSATGRIMNNMDDWSDETKIENLVRQS